MAWPETPMLARATGSFVFSESTMTWIDRLTETPVSTPALVSEETTTEKTWIPEVVGSKLVVPTPEMSLFRTPVESPTGGPDSCVKT